MKYELLVAVATQKKIKKIVFGFSVGITCQLQPDQLFEVFPKFLNIINVSSFFIVSHRISKELLMFLKYILTYYILSETYI